MSHLNFKVLKQQPKEWAFSTITYLRPLKISHHVLFWGLVIGAQVEIHWPLGQEITN